MPIYSGGNGKDSITGSNGDDTIFGLGGNDVLRGKAGSDSIFGGDGNDDIDGGTGNDVIQGDAGNDRLAGDDGNDILIGGAGSDTINGGSGVDTAVFSGSIFEYAFSRSGSYLTVSHNGGAGADGTDVLQFVEGLQFADYSIDLTQNNAPITRNDSASTNEDAGVYVSGSASVLTNDFDFEGSNLTVMAAITAGAYGTLTMNSNGTYSYALSAAAQALAQGEVVEDSFSYTVSDGSLSSTATLFITVAGVNDAPVAAADTASATENATILVDVLANDSDIDNGAVLTVAAASAPAGKGTASVVGNKVQFNPGTSFDHLAAGATETVVVSYSIADENGATASSTISITVTGTNDGPVAHPDTGTTPEDTVLVVDVLANDTDVDDGAVLTVFSASVPVGSGSVAIVGNKVQFDPGADFDYLLDGETAVVVVNYTIKDEHGASSSSSLTITVEGQTDDAIVGTDDGETITGTPDDDRISARGGDDIVFGLAGDDFIRGGDGSDTLNGDAGNDVLQGGNDDDVLSGGDGFDNLDGEAGNDTLFGGNDGDALAGGDGNDQLFGQAGADVLVGEDGNDQLSGGDGSDDLKGGAGDDVLAGGNDDDTLSGGEGDDTLDGGGGDDFLSDSAGINSFVGGLGNDQIVADSTDGAQTIDGGDGSDNITHNYRNFASTITTGAGSDTIEIVHADIGTAAITVTDFTTGAGGDMFRLEGDEDGSLLSLLSGWDGSSNPFGAGFLRLQQSGTATILQWDRDGAAGGFGWETLAVFQNTVVGDFTDANFAPGYPPDGSAPAGQTITGTNAGQTLTGTIGDDTINALGGNDTVFGRAGADIINGGDGSDNLNGEGGNDVIDGGNDADSVSGGDGNDQLFGQAGNDVLSGENGDDQLSGGDGLDSLSGDAGDDVIDGGNDDDFLVGGDGDDSLNGGDGNDFLSGGLGVNVLTGGLGNDQILADSTDGAQTIDGGDGNDSIRHYYRSSASTITTGAGSDTIEIAHADIGTAAITVTDFTTGGGGDMFRLDGDDGALLSLLSGWDSSSNPFASGFLRLEQSGSDTLLQWDRDGAGGGFDWETLAVFQNTTAGDFTDANFAPGYDPGGSAPAGETITGTAGDDILIGTAGGDTINALGGQDSVFGLAGADLINGGDGLDNLNGGDGNDVVQGGNGDDVLSGGDGGDQLFGQAGNDSLDGEAGDDHLSGGSGFDSLTGEDGADSFEFQSASDGADDITDFVSGTDHIGISASGFGGGLSAGDTVSLVSGTDPIASGTTGQFLYDTDDGSLLWDADGAGSGAAVLVATLTNTPAITAADFFVF